MQSVINNMLSKFSIKNTEDTINALREIIQQIALAGLWRSKFFEYAAFYGGTALRLFYGLDRFSEDIDFSLLKPMQKFSFDKYIESIKRELQSYGFVVETKLSNKKFDTPIKTGVVKTNTHNLLLTIKTESNIIHSVPHNQSLKIKIEVDTLPALGFSTEIKYLLQPIPFPARIFSLPDLFAGKMHAILCRNWNHRVKGRDWYDFVWYVTYHPELNLEYLTAKMHQSGHLADNESINKQKFFEYLNSTIQRLDITQAKKDIQNFIKDAEALSVWSKDFFSAIAQRIVFL